MSAVMGTPRPVMVRDMAFKQEMKEQHHLHSIFCRRALVIKEHRCPAYVSRSQGDSQSLSSFEGWSILWNVTMKQFRGTTAILSVYI